MTKNTGFLIPAIDSTHYVLGASPVPQNILQADGQWIKFVNDFEPQNKGYESYGCTIHGSINAIEILMRRQFLPDNYSERYSYIRAGITPPGADPHTSLESLRKTGLVDEEVLPWTDNLTTLEDYRRFWGSSESECDKKALEWLETYELKHEWVPGNKEAMKTALQYSPLGVAVHAWQVNSKGLYYTPEGAQANHWCLVIGYVEGEYWLVQDSYLGEEGQIKRLEWNYPFPFVKRYSLVVREISKKKLNLLESLLLTLREWLGLLPKESVKSVITPEVITPKMPEEPKYKWDTKANVRHSVRVICDEEGLNWANKNLICACIEQESGFNPKAIGKINKDGTQDFGLCQYNNGKNGRGQAYWIGANADFKNVDEVLNNPEKNVRVMIREFERGNLKYWSSYKTGAYKKYL